MATLSTHSSVSMQVSIPHGTLNMTTSNSHDKTMAATSIFKQEHQRMIKDPHSSSESHSQKPMWYFLLSRTGQAAAKRKVGALYKTTPGLTWEEKWAVTEAALRESRPEQINGIVEAILHMRKYLVYDGDSPLPNIFAGCITDDDRRDALLARPSSLARMALDTFSRRTASGQSMTSSSGTQDVTIDIQKASERDGEKAEEFADATRSSQFEDEQCDGYQSEDVGEEDPVWERLVRSCDPNYGTFR